MKNPWEYVRRLGMWLGPRPTAWLIAWTISVVASCISGRQTVPYPEFPECGDGEVHAYGWIQSDELAEPVRRRFNWPFFRDTPAGKAVLGDEQNVALWKCVEKCWATSPANNGQPYPNIDQKQVGCCVGCGTKHAADAVLACEIVLGNQNDEWKPLSAEAIYASGRVDIGKGQINGDGSLGAWSAGAATAHGFAQMEQIGGQDLRVFDPSRARSWGRSGVPREVKDVMAQHKMGSAAKISNWSEAKKALTQGYAIFICSNVGFEGRKDQEGFIRPSGTWPHCMALLGFQVGRREGGLILNSWGNTVHSGARGWGDPPDGCSFWADAQAMERILRQGDSYALSNFEGFPARRIDWWADGRPRGQRGVQVANRAKLELP